MVAPITTEAAITMVLLAACVVTVATLAICVYAHRQTRLLRRWNDRHRRRIRRNAAARRRQTRWTARTTAWR